MQSRAIANVLRVSKNIEMEINNKNYYNEKYIFILLTLGLIYQLVWVKKLRLKNV